ncbi:DUF2795 domain-containing protein [Chloroflexota bacterium]
MAAVKWDALSGYIDDIFGIDGRIARADVMALAEKDNASDDVVDAIDAIGSRAFTSPSDVRDFLTAQGYVAN